MIPQKRLLCSLYVHVFGVPTAPFVRPDIYIGRQAFAFAQGIGMPKAEIFGWRRDGKLLTFPALSFCACQKLNILSWSFGLMFWTEQ